MPRSKTPIPESFQSIEEAQEFWDRHSTADYDDELKGVEMDLSPELRTKIELRRIYQGLDLSVREIAKLEEKAKSENVSSKKLMSRWIVEHL